MKVQHRTGGANTSRWVAVGTPSDVANLFNSVQRAENVDPFHVYDFAVKNGFRAPAVNPSDFDRKAYDREYAFLNMPSPGTLQVARTLRARPRKIPAIDWYNLERTPEALKFQDSWNQWNVEPNGAAYELARIVVPKNEVGFITTIKQSVTFDDNTIAPNPGDIAWFTRDFGASGGQANLIWFLKFENMGDSGKNPYNFRSVTSVNCLQTDIPGTEHPDVPSWNKYIYPWCCDNRMFVFVPPNHVASLWIYGPTHLANAWQLRDVGGMLKGFTQQENSARTYENVTRGFVI